MIGRRKKRKKLKEDMNRADVSENSTSASIQKFRDITPDVCTELNSVLVFRNFEVLIHCENDFQCKCCRSTSLCNKYQNIAMRLNERDFHDEQLLHFGYDVFDDADMFFE